MSKSTFTKQVHRIRCDVFGCNNMSKYQIGSKGKPILNLNVCEECAKDIVDQIPDELKPKEKKVSKSKKKVSK